MTSANRLAESVKPVIEQLEGRTLMSVTIKPLTTDSSGNLMLIIRGDSKNDTVVITDDPAAGEVRVVANGSNRTIEYPGGPGTPGIEIFDVDLGGGNDNITFIDTGSPTAESYIGESRSLLLDGNTGNDNITLTIRGGLTAGSDIDVQIDGDSGNDNITVNFNYLTDSKLDLDITAGEGNDNILVNLPSVLGVGADAVGPTYNSNVLVDIETGNGRNRLDLNAGASIYYDSVVDIDVKGGNSTGSSYDTLNLDFDNTVVEGKLFVDVSAMSGDDRINVMVDNLYVETINFDNPEVPPVFVTTPAPVVRFNINGNDGKDQITSMAEESGMYIDETAFFAFHAKGGNGDDKITVDWTGPIDIALGGQAIVNIDGQNNNDTIVTSFFFDERIQEEGGGGQIDLSVKGGQNTDNVTFKATDLSTLGVTFGPSGFGPLIDGQTGTDRATVYVVNLLTDPVVRNFEQQNVTILPGDGGPGPVLPPIEV